MKVHSKDSTELEAVTTPDQFALHVSRPADSEGVSEMAREVHEEPRWPLPKGNREEYVWSTLLCFHTQSHQYTRASVANTAKWAQRN